MRQRWRAGSSASIKSTSRRDRRRIFGRRTRDQELFGTRRPTRLLSSYSPAYESPLSLVPHVLLLYLDDVIGWNNWGISYVRTAFSCLSDTITALCLGSR